MGKRKNKGTKIEFSWMQTYTSTAYEPFSPKPEMVNIVDIAHALSNNCRFNGHTRQFYSVAQHCVLVSKALEDEGYGVETQFFGLFHDAPEAYITDMVSPIKRRLPDFKKLEELNESVIFPKYHIKATRKKKARVKVADIRMLVTEARDVMGMAPKPWGVLAAPYTSFKIDAKLPHDAEIEFLLRFEELMLKRK